MVTFEFDRLKMERGRESVFVCVNFAKVTHVTVSQAFVKVKMLKMTSDAE